MPFKRLHEILVETEPFGRGGKSFAFIWATKENRKEKKRKIEALPREDGRDCIHPGSFLGDIATVMRKERKPRLILKETGESR